LPKVDVIDADIHDEEALNALFVGCHAVINLTAILNENKRGEFKKVHVELVEKVINACKNAGVTRLLQMSAINADAAKGSSQYLRSKGEGEALALAAEALAVTTFRPSVIFGKDDSFFNKFAELLLNLPVLPLTCPNSRMARVYVRDVAEVMVKAVNDRTTFGQDYDLCGPKSYTLQELVDYSNRLKGMKRTIIPLGNGMSAMLGRIMGMMPFIPFSFDNYLSLQTDAVSDKAFSSQFGVEPIPIENIVPKYIGSPDMRRLYDDIAQKAAHTKTHAA